jgi:hypothetical protein
MDNLPDELQRLILSKVSDNKDRATIRAVSKEYKHIIDENAPVSDQNRYKTMHALGMDKSLTMFLRRSVAAHRKRKLLKQMRTWKEEEKVTFIHHVAIFMNKLHVRKQRKLLNALHDPEYKSSAEGRGLLDAVRKYVDSRIAVELQHQTA